MNFIIIVSNLALSRCSSGGMFVAGNVTDVQLQKKNFKIVARDVSGEAQAGYLPGASFSMGATTNSFALVRIAGTGMLHKEALQNLWKSYETANGPVGGKKLALVNARYVAGALNLFVYTQPRLVLRADVIEITD